jgi:hypothetical protein
MEPNTFRNPPKQYRPSPFWSWNDDLKEDELRWQVRDMKEKGFGGYFMHSRSGLITEYLSEAWMKCIAATLDEGKKQDMESWLYDEDRWPSGAAGGLMTGKYPEFSSRSLVCEEVGKETPSEFPVERVALFAIEMDASGKLKTANRLTSPADDAKQTGTVHSFGVRRSARGGWYNGQSYADLLNPQAVQAFLECTHEAYAARFGKEYGPHMPGIFTDEPTYSGGERGVPWTGALPDLFQQWNGYDLVAKLPLLFFDGADAAKVRYDFWRTVTRLFVESFSIPVAANCEKHRIAMTGHYLAEDDLMGQILRIGAAMPHYEYMQLPGIDHLRRDIANPLTLKQVSSAAHQFGRNRVLCEIYGTSGHSMSFEDMKWISDWHFALGITFMNPHLTLYSMKGERKRDYPPTISYHQPYWQHYRLMNDYLSRCSAAMSQGRAVTDILVLHPIASAWASYRAPVNNAHQPNPEVTAYDKSLEGLVDNLLSIQRDFDFGDETIMARHARVDACEMVIGKMRYGIVIMPPSLTWSVATVDLLTKYVQSGGHLLCLGEKPSLVDGGQAGRLDVLFASENVSAAENTPESLRKALDTYMPPDVTVREVDGKPVPEIVYGHRVDGDEHTFFFANTSRTRGVCARISLKTAGSLVELLPATGNQKALGADVKDGRLTFHTDLPPVGSRIFVVDSSERPAEAGPPLATGPEKVVRAHDRWQFKRMQPNSMPLDYCRFAVGDEPLSERLPLWQVRKALRQRLGLGQYDRYQPWAVIKAGARVAPKARIRLVYEFKVRELAGSLALVVEQLKRWTLKLNEHVVPANGNQWHWDKQFGKVEIARYADEGVNTLEMATDYGVDTEIEDVYIVGEFGTFKDEGGVFHLSGEPDHLFDGDWGPQGYSFYAGNMLLTRDDVEIAKEEGKRYVLGLVNPKGTLFRVSVNGGRTIPICWQPWEVDVTDYIRNGANEIQIEVCGSLRNTMGPLHHKEGDALLWTGPAQFVDEKNWTDEYRFAQYGLLGGAEIRIIG